MPVKVAYYATSSARFFFFQILLKVMLVFKIMLLFLNVCLKIKKLKTSPKTQIVNLLLIKHHIFFILSYTIALRKHNQLLNFIPD